MKNRDIVFYFLTISVMLCSCSNELKLSKPNLNQKIKAGEWYFSNDSTKGISVREDKLAFFENMKFTSEDIYQYEIIDSIKKIGEVENKFGEYLVLKDFNDTIFHKVLKLNDSIIVLNLNGKNQTFKWSKPFIFK